jgi:hypothetical protein
MSARENPFTMFEPDPYAMNPFRILGVSVNSSLEQIESKVPGLERRLENGRQPAKGLDLKPGDPGRAEQALSDPLQRLAFELMYLGLESNR